MQCEAAGFAENTFGKLMSASDCLAGDQRTIREDGKRNLEVADCIVNGKRLIAFVAGKKGSQQEVREARKKMSSS